jgi:uncharacterized RDD family membrane protein YckC
MRFPGLLIFQPKRLENVGTSLCQSFAIATRLSSLGSRQALGSDIVGAGNETSPQTSREMTTAYKPPGLLRRFAAGIYDLLLVVALWFPSTAIALAIFRNDRHLPETAYRVYLLIVAFAFFGWFWTHGGQTLGMRAWRLKLIAGDGRSPGWYQALVRYLSMLIPWLLVALGLEFIAYPGAEGRWVFQNILAPIVFIAALAGFIWPLLDRRRLAWHDRLSASCLTVLPKPVKKSKSAKPTDGNQTGESQ